MPEPLRDGRPLCREWCRRHRQSSLTREYAYHFRQDYRGGQFEIDLSTITSIRGVLDHLVRLARDYLTADIPPTLPEAEQHARARARFQQLPAGQTVLLILDNLNEESCGIIGRANRDAALPTADKVHLLITTRAEPRTLGGMETVSLDILPSADALDLLFRYRPFARNPADPDYQRARADQYPLTELHDAAGDTEWKAALAISNRLGRHTLAVTLVGAYLGSYPDVSYTAFARDLAAHGIGLALAAAGNDDKVKNLIQHPETLIGPLFERSVSRLTPLALRTLEYAAFLPPDLVPLAWLQELVTQDTALTAALTPKPFRPPPWEETLRTLDGMQYLIGKPYARMHRVVQEVVRQRMSEDERTRREQAVLVFVDHHTVTIHDGQGSYADVDEITAAEQFVRARPSQAERLVGRTAMWLVPTLQNLGRLRNAINLARQASGILKLVLAADPGSAEKQRDLSISFGHLGDVSVAAGDLAAARAYYEQALAISRTLADADPASAQKQRDLVVSHFNLFDLEDKLGNRAAARAQLAAFVAVWGALEAEGRLPSPNDRAILKSLRRQLDEWAE